jgi:hypothetical protein
MKTVVWKSLEYPGMEHLWLDQNQSGIYVNSVVIGVENQAAFRLDYIIDCDGNYGVSDVNLFLGASKTLSLTSDGRGNWFDKDRQPLPELSGCIDIDISATPFTNTLPIQRISWQVGQAETLKMVYILIPDLTVSVSEQRYTCLEKTARGSVFRYENVDGSFTAQITVDSDGLVVHYPPLFERIGSS